MDVKSQGFLLYLMSMLNFIFEILLRTISQLITILGFFFVIGFILSKLQKWTQNQYQRSVGWLGILWTAWIGTPVHELAHAFFAKLFAHKIEKVSLFRPNRKTGMLGQVDHSYNPKNPYQNIGNFFIGAAPMIVGCLVLAMLFNYVLPGNQEILALVQKINFKTPIEALSGLFQIIIALFSVENIASPRFWIFMYLSFCVATHLAPSSYDQKTMWNGLLWLFIFLFIFNIGIRSAHINLSSFSEYFSLAWLTFAFWYASVVSFVHLLVASIILFPIRLMRR